MALFAVCGFGATRLLLPPSLRDHELLWVLPVGACVSALAFSVLGYAGVPFDASIVVVTLAGLAAAAYALRERGVPERPALATVAWPAYVAALLACVALIPMFRAGFPTVVGQGSDSHLAAGTARFLQHNYPTSTNIDEPLDQMHLAWRSKAPIYYPFAAIARVSGYETFRALSTVAALMGALAALGAFLLARQVLGSGLLGAVAAMGLVGLDRMVLHTVMHPYFNQTWGWFTFFFTLVLAWHAVRHRTRGTLILFGMFLAVGAFAYPLAVPIPLLAFGVFLWADRRARRERDEPPADLAIRRRLRGLYRGPRSLLWMIPAALVFSVPVRGVLEKAASAVGVVLPFKSLRNWGGDLSGYFPEHQFLALSFSPLWWAAAIGMGALMWVALRDRPRELAWGLFAVIGFGVLAAAYLRGRDYGYYFHFKLLAFTAPLLIACAAVGIERLRNRWLRAALLTAFVATAFFAALDETRHTFEQTNATTQQLLTWNRNLPRAASIRLDIAPNRQLWGAYMLYGHPLCTQVPLLGTDYPHVPIARHADLVMVQTGMRPPFDSTGPPVRRNSEYTIYRLKPSTPGPAGCSKRLVRTQVRIA